MLTKDGCAVAPRIVVLDEIWFALLTNALREGLINKVKSFMRQWRLFLISPKGSNDYFRVSMLWRVHFQL